MCIGYPTSVLYFFNNFFSYTQSVQLIFSILLQAIHFNITTRKLYKGNSCMCKIDMFRSQYVMCFYFIVVGSRRLMPPDALQSKAYCTNPGLYSFLLAPPGVSTREPSNERRNYLGEKWPVISTESCDFHAYTYRFFYMPQICDMGQTALLPFRRKAR